MSRSFEEIPRAGGTTAVSGKARSAEVGDARNAFWFQMFAEGVYIFRQGRNSESECRV